MKPPKGRPYPVTIATLMVTSIAAYFDPQLIHALLRRSAAHDKSVLYLAAAALALHLLTMLLAVESVRGVAAQLRRDAWRSSTGRRPANDTTVELPVVR